MNRQHLLTALALAAVAGCGADNRASIEITGVAAPTSSTTCEFSASGKNLLGNGLYDVALGGQFVIALYVRNNLVDPNTISPGATTQTKDWSVEAVRVRANPTEFVDRYHPSPALAAISSESILPIATSSIVQPSGGTATFVMGILSDGLLSALAGGAGAGGTVVLGLTLEGRTNDGARLDSSEFPYALDVCNGCVPIPTTCPTGTTLVVSSCVGQIGVPTCQ
jgi:hypothetical protein